MTIQLVSSNPEPNPSPFVWRRDWSFSYIKPDPNVFQRFGICGDCEVITRGGMVKISVAGVYISCPTISDLRAKTDTVSQ